MIRLYDTMSRDLRELSPEDGRTLRMYCCGPTVYGPAHLGNFRTFVVQDVLRRTLEALGVATTHVRNITDVDDKTIRESQACGMTLEAFTRHWTERFHADCAALNLLPPHVEPSAVAHIPDQIALIERLLQKGVAYRSEDGSVYFSVRAFPHYGRLSRLAEREVTTSQRQQSDEYERESAADFALWKAAKPADGQNVWASPWGPGRPGWHIECSTMAMKHLGETLDLHGGGVDLIFPHHENEIAQSESATGKTFVRHWFHSAHLLVDGTKMSKSLGNLFTLHDVKSRGFTPMELRYVLISGHYRQPLNFTWESMKASRSALERLQRSRQQLARAAGCPGQGWLPPQAPLSCAQPGSGIFEPVMKALADDLNTPKALGALFSALKSLEVNSMTEETARQNFRELDRVMFALGLDPSQAVRPEESSQRVPDEVQTLAEQRWQAKADKDFARADELRTRLMELGWSVKDGRDGYRLEKVAP